MSLAQHPVKRLTLNFSWRFAACGWQRAGERIVRWGENARHHRLGSWMQR